MGQHHGDLRQALLDIALHRLERGDDNDDNDDDGDDVLSLRALAKAAGVAPAAPYHHFGSREGLLAAIAKDGFERLSLALQTATATTQHPDDQLASMVATYVSFALSRAAHYRLMWSASLGKGRWPELEAAALHCFRQLVAAMAQVARSDDATATDDDVTQRAALAWSMAHGLVTLTLDGALAQLPGVHTGSLPLTCGRAAVDLARRPAIATAPALPPMRS